MSDMSVTIIAKSDQINADDLISGPRTITVSSVKIRLDSPEQPVDIFFDGDNGKPFRPCKTMRRLIVSVWGADANVYAGQSMTIYRDPDVKFGGMAVGGIRISHMTGIAAEKSLALMEKKGKRAMYRVMPLVVERAAPEPEPTIRNFRTVAEARNAVRDAGGKWTAPVFFDALQCELDNAKTAADYEAIRNRSDVATALEKFKPDQVARMQGMLDVAQSRCVPHIDQEGDGEYV